MNWVMTGMSVMGFVATAIVVIATIAHFCSWCSSSWATIKNYRSARSLQSDLDWMRERNARLIEENEALKQRTEYR